ncbi:MAG: hypothetical protein COB77_00460 [Gammaproteobacteria bacterium]|nr:MAG: hypothetical protein COB77_00460 [Gammaproteobacteria bacterium]
MCNLNISGQLIRIIFGLLLIALVWLGPQTQLLTVEHMRQWYLGWLGLLPLISGTVAFFPVYAILGDGHKK